MQVYYQPMQNYTTILQSMQVYYQPMQKKPAFNQKPLYS